MIKKSINRIIIAFILIMVGTFHLITNALITYILYDTRIFFFIWEINIFFFYDLTIFILYGLTIILLVSIE